MSNATLKLAQEIVKRHLGCTGGTPEQRCSICRIPAAYISLHDRMGRIEQEINERIKGEYKGFPVPPNATSVQPILSRILALTKGAA